MKQLGAGNRDCRVDIMKGVAILLVVLGHAKFPFTDFVYLFHVPVFFMLSGYMYRDSYSVDIKAVISLFLRRIKALYFPYVKYNLFFLLLWNYFINIGIYSNEHAFLGDENAFGLEVVQHLTAIEYLKKIIMVFLLFDNGGQMAGAFWFFRCLLGVVFLYVFFDFFLGFLCGRLWRFIFQCFISMSLLLIGCYLGENKISLWGLELIAVSYVLFFIGSGLRFVVPYLSREFPMFICLVLSFFLLLILYSVGRIEMSGRVYTGPLFFVVSSVSGWLFLYAGSFYIQKQNVMLRAFCFLGERTIPIIGLHFVCFKLVTYIQLKVYNLPSSNLAAYPVLYSGGVWWLVYSVLGVGLPIAIYQAYRTFKKYS